MCYRLCCLCNIRTVASRRSGEGFMCQSPPEHPISEAQVDRQTPPDEQRSAPPTPWKHWRTPVYTKHVEGKTNDKHIEQQIPMNGKHAQNECVLPTSTSDGGEMRQTIYGIGRNYNNGLGTNAFRTGASIVLDASLPTIMDNLRRNIETACADPRATVRLIVQRDQFWFSEASAAEIFDMCVMVGDGPTCKAERLNANWEEAVPAGASPVGKDTGG